MHGKIQIDSQGLSGRGRRVFQVIRRVDMLKTPCSHRFETPSMTPTVVEAQMKRFLPNKKVARSWPIGQLRILPTAAESIESILRCHLQQCAGELV